MRPIAPMSPRAFTACTAFVFLVAGSAARADHHSHSYSTSDDPDAFSYRLIEGHEGNSLSVGSGWEFQDFDEPGFYFRLDGKEYAIHDLALIAKADEITRPMRELGRKQGALGRLQGELGRKQGEIGRRQGKIGMLQGRIAMLEAQRRSDDEGREDLNDLKRELASAQGDLADLQRPLAERQAELGRQQAELGRQQRRASAEAGDQLEDLARHAIRDGSAERVDR